MIDKQSILEQADLLTLAEHDSQLRRVASTGGGEYAGPCPFCGGRDRFRVQPYKTPWGLWMCRQCTSGKWQNAIDYVIARDNCGFKRACEILSGAVQLPAKPTNNTLYRPPNEPLEPPPAAWQDRGKAFAESCQAALWSQDGARALDYLRRRGLADETIRYYRLGYNPEQSWQELQAWGLPEDNDHRFLGLPRGIVIPCYIAGVLWYVKIRRPRGSPKYIQVRGSKPALFGADNLTGADIVLLTEGEFDCMLSTQLVGDSLGVATLGAAGKKMSLQAWGVYLLPARAILAAYDSDQAGQSGLAALASLSERIYPVRIPVLRPGDKDITDYHLAGGNLWEWLKYHLHKLGVLWALRLPDE